MFKILYACKSILPKGFILVGQLSLPVNIRRTNERMETKKERKEWSGQYKNCRSYVINSSWAMRLQASAWPACHVLCSVTAHTRLVCAINRNCPYQVLYTCFELQPFRRSRPHIQIPLSGELGNQGYILGNGAPLCPYHFFRRRRKRKGEKEEGKEKRKDEEEEWASP